MGHADSFVLVTNGMNEKSGKMKVAYITRCNKKTFDLWSKNADREILLMQLQIACLLLFDVLSWNV